MRLQAAIQGDLNALLKAELGAAERAVTAGIRALPQLVLQNWPTRRASDVSVVFAAGSGLVDAYNLTLRAGE